MVIHAKYFFCGAFIFALFAMFMGTSCNKAKEQGATDDALYKKIQTQLIQAKPGDIIDIPSGIFHFDKSLMLDKIPNITIRGSGKDKTILSFKNQISGAEGIHVVADNVTIEDLTIQDTKGDGIKLQHCDRITLRNLNVTWTGGADEKNGGYGYYPVESKHVLIEKCEVSFASDAGVYVGQSENVIVRECFVHENVAGIEIENCINSDVYKNKAIGNTGGILIFDMPDLKLKNGHTCRVFDNEIRNNNHANFAPKGNIVAITPPGTGVILLAAKNTEVFNNKITGHKTIGIAIASFLLTGREIKDTAYNPYCSKLYVHDNQLERKTSIPDMSTDFGKMVNYVFSASPQDILFDGILRKPEDKVLCLKNNTAKDALRFANVDAANDFKSVIKEVSAYECEGEALSPVSF